MRLILALLASFLAVGCATGVDPRSVSYATAPLQATGPEQTFGTNYSTHKALDIPASVINCLTTGLAKMVNVVGETGVCVFENITPPVIVPVQTVAPAKAAAPDPCVKSAPMPVPVAAPKPVCHACAGETCELPR